MSKVRSIRASEKLWETWAEAAAASDKSLNGWMIDACNAVADRDLAEFRRAADLAAERDREKQAMRGLFWDV